MEEKEIIAEKTPDILKLEEEIKKKGEKITISLDGEEQKGMSNSAVKMKKVRTPKVPKVSDTEKEEKSSQEIKEELFEELRLEEKRYTQEIEEEPLNLPENLPEQISTLPEKFDCKPLERQILEEKPLEIPKITEKQELEMDVILLRPYEDFIKRCPICTKKMKKKSVKRNGMVLTQLMICKNKKCGFQKEITITI